MLVMRRRSTTSSWSVSTPTPRRTVVALTTQRHERVTPTAASIYALGRPTSAWRNKTPFGRASALARSHATSLPRDRGARATLSAANQGGRLWRYAKAAAVVFVALHISLSVARSVPVPDLWKTVDAKLFHIPTRLRLYSAWNMFAMERKKPDSSSAYVMAELVLTDGSELTIGTPRPEGKSLFERFRDRRWSQVSRWVAKKKARRRYGKTVMRSMCSAARRDGLAAHTVRLVQVLTKGTGSRRPKRRVLAELDCRTTARAAKASEARGS